MRSALRYFPVIQNKNPIAELAARKPVGNVNRSISSKTDAIVPNPVILAPYRTFLEVEQPESSFIFRMRDSDRGGVSCALFEADGGAWRNEAMSDVAAYIIKQLSGRNLPEGMFTVIY